MTLVVNSVTEARDNTDRYVYVWLVDPLSAVDWIEEKQIVWSSGTSENKITTTAKLGQDTISTNVNDYWVALRGVSIKRDTDLRTDKSYIYVGKATGNSGGIPTFSTTDQKLLESIYNFEQEVIDARTSDVYGAKASLDLRIEEVDGEVNTARDGKTTLQDRLEGEAEFNVIIDTADKGDYLTLAAYIADSPAAGDRVLINVDEEITGATMVIPANIMLQQQKNKKFWCDEDLAIVLQFSDGIVTVGEILLDLSHTGTVTTAISFNGGNNSHFNLRVGNLSTGTVTNAFKIESGKRSNVAKGEAIEVGAGLFTNILVDSSGTTDNDIVIRKDGGVINGGDGTADYRMDQEHEESGLHSDGGSYGWHGDQDTIKILSGDFSSNDASNPAVLYAGFVSSLNATVDFYANIPIPMGYKATAVRIYSSVSRDIDVLECDIDTSTSISKGTGNTTAEIDITDVTADGTNYLNIQVKDINSAEIRGGYVTIAKA